jgi:hypothetical protein
MGDMETIEEMVAERNKILILVDKIYYNKLQRKEIQISVFNVNLMIHQFPEGVMKDKMLEKIKMKYRYAPMKNDTGNIDYTGHGGPHFY